MDASHDIVAAMADWVEKGVTPKLIASKVDSTGKVTRTQPLCPYPAYAKWTGVGSSDDAANFVCVQPK
jgi:feruloyl esterase